MSDRYSSPEPGARIDSQKHPIIRTLREIQSEGGREQRGAFSVEGPRLVRRALDYGVRVLFLVYSDRFASAPEAREISQAARAAGAEEYLISEGLMTKAISAKPAPGVVAAVERRLCEPDDLLSGQNPLLFLIDRCENPDNLGMLLRSVEAAGTDGVVLTSDSVDPFNRLCVRASRGAVLSLKLAITGQPEDWLLRARSRGFRVVASSAHAEESIWSVGLTGPTIIVVGNEHEGVRESIRRAADEVVLIPMSGRMESLNIAVAAAILAYEAVRQRRESDAEQH
ncbi:MAG: RNA methyltransferase [Armatimonadetes bacterium]|nr:RNA methyltransferase [Armatimonadota bacterium]